MTLMHIGNMCGKGLRSMRIHRLIFRIPLEKNVMVPESQVTELAGVTGPILRRLMWPWCLFERCSEIGSVLSSLNLTEQMYW